MAADARVATASAVREVRLLIHALSAAIGQSGAARRSTRTTDAVLTADARIATHAAVGIVRR